MMAQYYNNFTPSFNDAEQRSLIQIFSNTKVEISYKYFKPFGCPIYVLNDQLQKNYPYYKWNIRSSQGIYLGPLPTHNPNVALVLNK